MVHRYLLKKHLSIFLLIGLSGLCYAEQDNPCDHLSKVESVSHLLKQVYDTLNTDCLFDMSTEELEYLWEIEIIDLISLDPEEIKFEWNKIDENENKLYIIRKSGKNGQSFQPYATVEFFNNT